MRNATTLDEVLPQTSEDPGPEERLEHIDSLDHVGRILAKLPTAQQSIMKMRHVEGMEIGEIAEIMDMTEAKREGSAQPRTSACQGNVFKIQN